MKVMIYYEDKKYKFFELFNEKNGTLIRSNVSGTQMDATMRSFPELLDVGIMGQCNAAKAGICSRAGIECYQNAISSNKKNMSLENYETIMKQCKNRVFQVALGGAGDPNKHEFFEEVLSMTREYGIVPNLTTSGYDLLEQEIHFIKKYCGAVAVSFYSRIESNKENNDVTIDAIRRFVNNGCKTNIHFVVSDDSIDEATYRLENEIWPTGIEAIIFILYKPVGLGKREKIVKKGKRLARFLNAAIRKKHLYRVGFDTCFTSALIKYSESLEMSSVDACEAGRFSMYIDAEMYAYPCSFDNQQGKYRVSMENKQIEEIWNGIEFEHFRNKHLQKCNTCKDSNICNYGCGLKLEIDLC